MCVCVCVCGGIRGKICFLSESSHALGDGFTYRENGQERHLHSQVCSYKFWEWKEIIQIEKLYVFPTKFVPGASH